MARSSEEQRKLEEAQRKAEEEEARRIEEEVTRQTELRRKLRDKKKEPPPAEEEKERREEENRRRREEEERQRRDEEARRQREGDERRRREDENRRRKEEEDRRRKEEEDRRRRDEEERKRREEQERREREKEERRKEEERQRTLKTLKKAEEYLSEKEFDKALGQIESIISSDPMHREALALDEKIRTAKSRHEAERPKEAERAAAEAKAAPVEAPLKPAAEKVIEKKEKLLVRRRVLPKGALIGPFVAILAIIGSIVIYQMTHTLLEGKPYVAVFPFTSQANSDDERLLGVTLAEEIATLLGYFPDARVMGPTSAVNLYRTTRNPRSQAHKFNFAHTLSGTISISGSDILLYVELIDTLGNKMWSGKFERSLQKLMELPAELVGTVSEGFGISISKESDPLLSRMGTSSGEAYLAYLRGRNMLHRGTYGAANSAVAMFQQAASRDPGFAEAQAAHAHALFHIYEAGWSNQERLLAQAQELARKALANRPMLAEAHTVLGGVDQLQRRYRESVAALTRGIDQMPNSTEAHRFLGIAHAIGGNEGKALDHISAAYELDPVNVDVLTSAALVHQRFEKPKEAMVYFNRALAYVTDTSSYLATVAGSALVASYQYDRAIALYERRVAQDPRNYVDQYKLARAYQLAAKDRAVWSKAFEKTIAMIQGELRQQPQNALATVYLGLAYSRYGRFPEGEANGKKALQSAPDNIIVKYKLADIYSIQKKKIPALSALREAVGARYVLEEIGDLDLFNIGEEPEFAQTIIRPIE